MSRISLQSEIPVWLAKHLSCGKMPFARCMPYSGDARVSMSVLDDFDLSEVDMPAIDMPQEDIDSLQREYDDEVREMTTPLIDMNSRARAVPRSAKNRINKVINRVTKGFLESIPLGTIFAAMKNEGLIAVQEDGTMWDGMLVGGAECGTEGARDQVATFTLAMRTDDGGHVKASAGLYLSWCKMSSGKYDVVCYLS